MDGLLLINKTKGITSFDVIRKLRKILADQVTSNSKLVTSSDPKIQATSYKLPRIGHAGTLDPMATGLMLLLFGSATKQAARFSKLDKTYEAEVTLGFNSSTADAEGSLSKVSDAVPERAEVEQALNTFIGQITQIPPKFSAIKVGGRRAYKLARQGQEVEIPSRNVTIYDLQITGYKYPTVACTTTVSSGTYIRSLAQDLGQKLGTGAYLSGLKRTKIGGYELADAIDLETADKTVILNAVKNL